MRDACRLLVVTAILAGPLTAAAQPPASADPHAGHVMPAPPAAAAPEADQQAQESHAGHDHGTPGPAPVPGTPEPRRGHVESAPPPARVDLPPFIPPVTDAMRADAFPDVHGHAAHDRAINAFVLVDQLEWRSGRGADGPTWNGSGWVGGDVNRVWFRSEGESEGSGVDDASAHVLYGRAVARWWDVVAGIRQDLQPGAQSWLAFGVQGLAPGFFEVEATAYVSDAGQTAAHLEVEYDLLLTNRLVLQPVVEANLYGRSNAALGVGRGLSTAEAGFRLRYEVRREFAPYVGVTWAKTFGRTRDLGHGEASGAPRLVTGVRVWF